MAEAYFPEEFPVEMFVSRYPWLEWLDGRVWKIKKGEDFIIDVYRMSAQIHSKARSWHIKARTHIHDEDTIFFQALVPPPKPATD